MRFQVRELRVERENGDRDVIYLCGECEPTTQDFLKVLSRRNYDTGCDRCGRSAGDADRDAKLGRFGRGTP